MRNRPMAKRGDNPRQVHAKLARLVRMGVQQEQQITASKGWRGLGAFARRFAANNWKVVVYVILIILCVLFAPEEPLKFIYTEF